MRRRDRIIAAYLDGALPPSERARIEQRLRADAALRQELEQAAALARGLGALPELRPPRDLVAAAQARLEAERSGRDRRRPRWWLLAPVSLTSAVVAVALWSWVAPPRSTDPAPMPVRMVASAVSGVVWSTSPGARRRAAVGDVILSGQRLETDAGASVTLVNGSTIRILVDEQSEIVVVEAAGDHPAVSVDHGALRARAQGPDVRLEVRLRGSLAWVELRSGSLGVLHQPGATTVACAEGKAAVHGAGESTHLSAGEEALLDERGARGLRASPAALALEVGEPARDAQLRVELSGRTNSGSQVWVDGVPVTVGADGRFARVLVLAPGQASVTIVARDALLRRKELQVAVRSRERPMEDAPEPRLRPAPGETQWQWDDGTPG